MQYALRERAISLGWKSDQVVVIDSDLGLTGSTSQGRLGFQDLVSRVSLDQAGAVFAFDVTRFARNCSDWYQLLDLCGLRQCLIGDGDSIYDPAQIDGRLLLGLKGQISELELHTIRARLTAGMLNKAKRGELIIDLPIGYIKASDGSAQKHADQEAQSRIKLIFDQFMKLRSLGKVVRFLNENQLRMPRRIRGGSGVRWREPTKSSVSSMLRNPTYAGAYAYGKTRFVPQKTASHKRYKQRIDQDQWKVLLRDLHPGYITWDSFQSIQEILEGNMARYNSLNSAGTPRAGSALLQGLLYCGKCGHQMTVQYRQGGQYRCNYLYQQRCLPVCISTRSTPVDQLVAEEVFGTLNAAEFDLLSCSITQLSSTHETIALARQQKLQRLHYEAQRAETQYHLCDPQNRLVASELERRWEEAMRLYREAKQAHHGDSETMMKPSELSPTLAKQWAKAGDGLNSLWADGRLSNEQKKRIVRSLVQKVVVTQPQVGQVKLRIVWKSGMATSKVIHVKVGSLSSLPDGDALKSRIERLSKEDQASDAFVAYTLSREGFRGCDRDYVSIGLIARVRAAAGIKLLSPHRISRFDGGLSLAQLARKVGVKIDWLFEQIIYEKVSIEPDYAQRRFIISADSEVIGKLEALRNPDNTISSQREAS